MLGTFYYLQKFLRLSVIVSFNLPICSLKNEDDGPVASFSNRDRLGIIFCQITTFITVRMAFCFWILNPLIDIF